VPGPTQVLDEPGSADLSAWVDFGALRQAAVGSGAPVRVCGPVTQADFLMQLGLQQRLQRLMQVSAAHLPAHSFSDHTSIKGHAF
jgi:SAM-dependent MidA family methyltransferase